MMPEKLQKIFLKIKNLTLKQIIQKILIKFEYYFLNFSKKLHDYFFSTYHRSSNIKSKLVFLIPEKHSLQITRDSANSLKGLCKKYLKHEFDFLGSGWIKVEMGMKCYGFDGVLIDSRSKYPLKLNFKNYFNNKYSNFIRNKITDGYCPIDWHIDFKSGYRWNHDGWYRDIEYGGVLGVDIKVPWELARLQHLPQLALVYASTEDEYLKEDCLTEFKNVVLDFISSNPPRYGVNWVCTMEVAIRAANMLVALDIFKSQGIKFELEFMDIFINYIEDHRTHILQNLEWSSIFRGNHYLANIVGALMIERYLPLTPRKRNALNLLVSEFDKEIRDQFNDDGSNFEGSTAYHQLSAEFLIVGSALLRGLYGDDEKLDLHEYKIRNQRIIYNESTAYKKIDLNSLYERLNRKISSARKFSNAVELNEGQIIQVGDNDSGRLFKFKLRTKHWSFEEIKNKYLNISSNMKHDDYYLCVDLLNYDGLNEFYDGISDADNGFGSVYIKILSKGRFKHFITQVKKVNLITKSKNISIPKNKFNHKFLSKNNLFEGLVLSSFPDFGLFIWRGAFLYLAVRCGNIGQKGWGGHSHNDQLGVELWIDGQPVFRDPGSYVYTGSKHLRNLYRSAKSHFVPYVEELLEPGSFSEDIFSLGDEAKAEVIELSKNYFLGMHLGYGVPVYREVIVSPDAIEVNDWSNDEAIKLTRCEAVGFSNGYGWRSSLE